MCVPMCVYLGVCEQACVWVCTGIGPMCVRVQGKSSRYDRGNVRVFIKNGNVFIV